MTLHRFFVEPADAAGDRFPLPAAIERQVRNVLRLRDGDRLVLLTGDGTEVLCRLAGDTCEVQERRPVAAEPSHRLTVIQAVLKGDALEEGVARGTEVGVASFRLMVSDRCVTREVSARRLDRLRSIARESAEQSERGVVPDIQPPVPFTSTLTGGAVLLYERAGAEARLGALEPPSEILIGPEGGFTPAEVARAVDAGIRVVGLGPRILRSQTVCPVAAAIILSRAGDFA